MAAQRASSGMSRCLGDAPLSGYDALRARICQTAHVIA